LGIAFSLGCVLQRAAQRPSDVAIIGGMDASRSK